MKNTSDFQVGAFLPCSLENVFCLMFEYSVNVLTPQNNNSKKKETFSELCGKEVKSWFRCLRGSTSRFPGEDKFWIYFKSKTFIEFQRSFGHIKILHQKAPT